MNGLGYWQPYVKYFVPTEDGKGIDKWGDPHKIQESLLKELFDFRHYIGMPVIVTSGYRDRKSKANSVSGSQHPLGTAADVVIPHWDDHPFNAYLAASRFGFKGIGVYRDWQYNGVKMFGMHLDVRAADHRAQWFCYRDENGEQQYTDLSVETMRKHKFL